MWRTVAASTLTTLVIALGANAASAEHSNVVAAAELQPVATDFSGQYRYRRGYWRPYGYYRRAYYARPYYRPYYYGAASYSYPYSYAAYYPRPYYYRPYYRPHLGFGFPLGLGLGFGFGW